MFYRFASVKNSEQFLDVANEYLEFAKACVDNDRANLNTVEDVTLIKENSYRLIVNVTVVSLMKRLISGLEKGVPKGILADNFSSWAKNQDADEVKYVANTLAYYLKD